MQKFRILCLSRKYLILADFPVKIGLNGGQGGVPPIFFLMGILLFMLLGSLSGIYFKIAHFLVKIGLIGRVGGVTEILFSWESSYFCYLGAHAKIQNPSCLLSGRKAMA